MESYKQEFIELSSDNTKNSGFDFEYIHTGAVIRRKDVFTGFSMEERRKLLLKMLNFGKKTQMIRFE